MDLQKLKNLPSEQVYQQIMLFGKQLPPFDPEWKKEENLVPGCQSIMYLHASLKEGRLYFAAHSEALISAGLAAILISVYDGETPETILKAEPTFLEELNIPGSLTPGRANGLASLWLKMKQAALKALI